MGLNQIQYPALGQTSNWGGIINRNFKILVDEIEKVNNQAEATKNLVGAGVPYVRQDNSKFFVKIVELDSNGDELTSGAVDGYRLDYYDKTEYITWGEDSTKQEPNPTASYYSKLYNASYKLFSAIPNFLGAYVLNTIALNSSVFADSSEQNTTGNVEYTRGDYMVRVSSFGSIYSENYAQAQFVLYPIQAGGYIPFLNIDNPYSLKYKQVDSVDWLLGSPELITNLPPFALTSAHTFRLYDTVANGSIDNNINIINDSKEWQLQIIFKMPSQDKIYPIIKFFINESDGEPIQSQECLLSYKTQYQITSNAGEKSFNHKFIYTIDASSLVSNINIKTDWTNCWALVTIGINSNTLPEIAKIPLSQPVVLQYDYDNPSSAESTQYYYAASSFASEPNLGEDYGLPDFIQSIQNYNFGLIKNIEQGNIKIKLFDGSEKIIQGDTQYTIYHKTIQVADTAEDNYNCLIFIIVGYDTSSIMVCYKYLTELEVGTIPICFSYVPKQDYNNLFTESELVYPRPYLEIQSNVIDPNEIIENLTDTFQYYQEYPYTVVSLNANI